MKDIIGALEYVCLLDLNMSKIIARVDTGATTSSLHVESLILHDKDEKAYVTFTLEKGTNATKYFLPVHKLRKVRSSNGDAEKRPVIKTNIQLGERLWEIQLSLTNREKMRYPMLLGREAMGSKFLVNPAKNFLQP